jgi:hypothetical protein
MSTTTRRPTIGNMPGADLDVTFPSGEKRTVNMIILLVETQNAEFKRDHGMFLPSVGKLRPTVKALVEKYELDWFASEVYPNGVRTWEECAAAMRHIHTLFGDHIKATRG